MRYSSERINRIAADNRYQELINASEAKHILQFENLVRMITESHRHSLNKNITDAVLITGPSSSGKTTTSKLVAAMLRSRAFMLFSSPLMTITMIRIISGSFRESLPTPTWRNWIWSARRPLILRILKNRWVPSFPVRPSLFRCLIF